MVSLTCVFVLVYNGVLQVFSIVVFGCIASQGRYLGKCFNSHIISDGVCSYGIAIGVMAFLLLLVFLGLDALFDNVSNVQLRKYMVIADVMCSGELLGFTFAEQLCFCFGWLVGLSTGLLKKIMDTFL